MLDIALRSTIYRVKNRLDSINLSALLPIVDDLENIRDNAIDFTSDLVQEVTYAAAAALRTAGTLSPGVVYFLTDKNIYVKALSTTGFAEQATYKATLIDWQNVTGNFLGLWTSGLAGVALNKLCAYNTSMYVNITGSNGASNPTIDTTNWTVIATTDSRYQTEYDSVIYNFTDNYIVARWDKRGNFVQCFDQSNINTFQWGRDATFSNFIYSLSVVDYRNAVTGITYTTVIRSAVIITGTATMQGAYITAGSSINLSGTANANFIVCNRSNLTMTAGACADAKMDMYATLTITSSSANGGLSTYRNCSITLTGTSQILGCYIDGGTALSGIFTKTFASESHSNKRVVRGESSNFVYPSQVAVASTDTTLALPGSGFYGYYGLTVSGGQAVIDTISGLPSSFPTSVRITNDGTNAISFTQSASINMDRYAYTLVGDNDFIEFFAQGAVAKMSSVSVTYVDPGSPVGGGITTITQGKDGQYITTIYFTALAMGNTGGAANKAMGVLIYTMASANVVVYDYTYMSVALNTATVAVQTDTPEIGIGSVAASGAVAVLSGTATFEDRITGQVAANVNGTATVVTLAPTAGVGTGIIAVGGVKALYLNIADGWAAAADITATGTVSVKWSVMS